MHATPGMNPDYWLSETSQSQNDSTYMRYLRVFKIGKTQSKVAVTKGEGQAEGGVTV